MKAQEIVQSLWNALEKNDYVTAKSYLSDDFQFSGPVPEPVKGEEWMMLSASMKTAFPDLDYHFSVEGIEGDEVKTTHQFSGTHTGDLDLTAMGMGVIPSTGKSFSMPKEYASGIVRDGKVVSYQIEPTEGGGLMALLSQLGISIPSE